MTSKQKHNLLGGGMANNTVVQYLLTFLFIFEVTGYGYLPL